MCYFPVHGSQSIPGCPSYRMLNMTVPGPIGPHFPLQAGWDSKRRNQEEAPLLPVSLLSLSPLPSDRIRCLHSKTHNLTAQYSPTTTFRAQPWPLSLRQEHKNKHKNSYLPPHFHLLPLSSHQHQPFARVLTKHQAPPTPPYSRSPSQPTKADRWLLVGSGREERVFQSTIYTELISTTFEI